MQTTKLISLIVPLLLSGCVAAPLVLTGIGATSLAVNETTGKTITDNAVSAVNRQDCRLIRMFKDQPVCQDENIVTVTTTGVTPSTVEEIQARYSY